VIFICFCIESINVLTFTAPNRIFQDVVPALDNIDLLLSIKDASVLITPDVIPEIAAIPVQAIAQGKVILNHQAAA